MPEENNVTRIRVGLAIIAVVVIVALALVAVIDSPVGRAVMFAVALTGFVRAFLLYRSLRREQRGSPAG